MSAKEQINGELIFKLNVLCGDPYKGFKEEEIEYLTDKRTSICLLQICDLVVGLINAGKSDEEISQKVDSLVTDTYKDLQANQQSYIKYKFKEILLARKIKHEKETEKENMRGAR